MGYVWRNNTLSRARRDGIDILASLLEGVSTSENPFTRIVYHMNISYDRAVFYLKFAIERGLIEEGRKEKRRVKVYRITAKGLKFLNLYYMQRDLLISEKTNAPNLSNAYFT